jgi:hypothetical protein
MALHCLSAVPNVVPIRTNCPIFDVRRHPLLARRTRVFLCSARRTVRTSYFVDSTSSHDELVRGWRIGLLLFGQYGIDRRLDPISGCLSVDRLVLDDPDGMTQRQHGAGAHGCGD